MKYHYTDYLGKVEKKVMIRNRFHRIPHPFPNIIREGTSTVKTALIYKQHKVKATVTTLSHQKVKTETGNFEIYITIYIFFDFIPLIKPSMKFTIAKLEINIKVYPIENPGYAMAVLPLSPAYPNRPVSYRN